MVINYMDYDVIKKRLLVLQLKLNLLTDEIDDLKEKIKKGYHKKDVRFFNMMVRSVDFKADRIKKEVREYALLKLEAGIKWMKNYEQRNDRKI